MVEPLLPTSALPVTVALAKVNAGRPAWPTDLVSAVADPVRCPVDLLGYLAWSRSVDVWNEDWPEAMKRYVVGRAFQDHRLKGTLALAERYCRYVDAKVIGLSQPPQRFVLGRRKGLDELRRLHGRLPEIRIYPDAPPRFAPGAVLGRLALGAGMRAALVRTEPRVYHERRVELHRDGEVIQLRIAEIRPSELDDETEPFEQLYIPRFSPNAFALGRAQLGKALHRPVATEYVASFIRSPKGLGRVTISAGGYATFVQPERVFPKAPLGPLQAALGRPIRRALFPSTAADRVFDRLRLWDRKADVIAPRIGGVLGQTRLGGPALTATLSIEVITKARPRQLMLGGPLRRALHARDPKPLARVLDALRAAKLPHERILVDLDAAFERRLYGAVS